MNTGLKLGGVAALLLAGVFYTFALCIVEDVDENVVMPEYLYAGEVFPDETEAVTAEDETVPEIKTESEAEKPQVIKPEDNEPVEDVRSANISEREVRSANKNEENIAVSAVTVVKDTEEENYREDDEDIVDDGDEEISGQDTAVDEYPENAESDETISDIDSAEVSDRDFYGSDDDENGTFLKDDSEVDEPAVTTVKKEEPENIFTEAANIIITIDTGNNESSDKTDVPDNTVSTGGNADTSFTAKFNGSTQTVNAYDLICWIVNNEISESFSDEAIKAQAVAAYSYVKYHNDKGLTPSVLVKKNPSQRIKDMVSSVWGVCCYYNGSAAETVYMASSSGYTADAANVWGGSVPYLKSVACPFDAQSDPNYGLTTTVSEDEMRSMLENSLGIALSDNPKNWIKITSYIDGNYVSTINIDDQKTISGRKMRENVFSYKLKSASFDVSYSDGVFTFTTYGYGHGVGMSQNGANILAKQGYSYSEILKYYFTGIDVI